MDSRTRRQMAVLAEAAPISKEKEAELAKEEEQLRKEAKAALDKLRAARDAIVGLEKLHKSVWSGLGSGGYNAPSFKTMLDDAIKAFPASIDSAIKWKRRDAEIEAEKAAEKAHAEGSVGDLLYTAGRHDKRSDEYTITVALKLKHPDPEVEAAWHKLDPEKLMHAAASREHLKNPKVKRQSALSFVLTFDLEWEDSGYGMSYSGSYRPTYQKTEKELKAAFKKFSDENNVHYREEYVHTPS